MLHPLSILTHPTIFAGDEAHERDDDECGDNADEDSFQCGHTVEESNLFFVMRHSSMKNTMPPKSSNTPSIALRMMEKTYTRCVSFSESMG